MIQISEILKELELPDIQAIDKNGNTALHLTVRKKTFTQKTIIEVLGILLDSGINPDITNKDHATVLQLSVVQRMKDVIDFLMIRNVSSKDSVVHFWIKDEYDKLQRLLWQPNDMSKFDKQILEVETESRDFIEWLMSKGFNFHSRNKGRESAFDQIIRYNLQHILLTLLKCSKDISFVDKRNRTLLHLYLEYCSTSHSDNYCTDFIVNRKRYSEQFALDIVKILLDRGISADAEDEYNVTPTEMALKKQAYVSIIKVLLERCTKIHRRNRDNQTILQVAVTSSLSYNSWPTKYNLDILPLIMAKGTDISEVNEPDKFGEIPLCSAVKQRNLGIIDFLRDNGADFCVATKDGETLLHLLANSKHNPIDKATEMTLFNLFISKGCQVNAQDVDGNTPLHVAVTYDNIAIVRKLIEHGADVNCKRHDGVTPLCIAAVEKFNVPIVETLRENGADFNSTKNDGETLLHLFIKKANRMMIMLLYGEITTQIFNLLITEGCQVNAKGKAGNSPLHLAAMHSDSTVIRTLIEHGADVNCKNNQMETPLNFALNNSVSEKTVELLLERGADVNARNVKGQTVSHVIADELRPTRTIILQTLLKYGADVNAQDANGFSVLCCARNRDSQDYKKQCEEYVLEYNDRLFFKSNLNNWDSEVEIPIPGQITISDCPLKEKASDVVALLTEHVIKLKAASLPLNKEIGNWLEDPCACTVAGDYCERYYKSCLEEIEKLKSTFIDRTSLYTFLHHNLNDRCAYVNTKKLKNIVNSPKLEKQFPKYASIIFSGYREAVIRRSLLEPAKKGWLELTEIDLPDLCLECIFSFLGNSDLFNMIED